MQFYAAWCMILYMINDDYLIWLEYARKDIGVADLLYEKQQNRRKRPHEAILFHCQQGAEKALKAYIIRHGANPEKARNLNEQLRECLKHDDEFNKARLANYCAFLLPYTMIVQYPKHNLIIDADKSTKGLNSAKRIYDFVCERLGLGSYYFAGAK